MQDILKKISLIGIVPVIAIDDAEKAVSLAKALMDGGLQVAEVTFRTEAAEEAIRRIAKEVPGMHIGAGTVLTREQVDKALDAGAQFIVSPGFNSKIVEYVISKNALIIPGTATPGEMEMAMALGLEVVKFFPAEQNGGVAKLRAIAGPYKTLKWMPTGGINSKNVADYLAFDQVIACGGTWMVKPELIESESWDDITRITNESVKNILGFSLGHVGINCSDSTEAKRTAETICAIFGFDYKPGNSSDFAGSAVECMKEPYLGTHGHISILTNSIDRAVYHLSLKGVEFNEETRKIDAKGRTKAIYLNGEYSGYAIHLLQR